MVKQNICLYSGFKPIIMNNKQQHTKWETILILFEYNYSRLNHY